MEYEFKNEFSIEIFRIIQESLTNAARHSKATIIKIDIEISNNTFILSIKDNGIGISKEAEFNLKKFGILGIKERISKLNGKIKILTAENEGVNISIEIPNISEYILETKDSQ